MPDQPPFWSVVIPLYNKGPYIEATVASVLAQSDTDFEIVVVDDGSSDDGPSLVAALADPRIRLIRQANAGVSAARNRGIEASLGQFIAFLDGDDVYHPRCLERLRALHEAFPASKLLGGNYVRVPHALVIGYVFPPQNSGLNGRLVSDLPAEFLRRGLPFCSSSVAVNRLAIKGMPNCFPVGESLGEDLDVWFRIAEDSPVAVTDCELAVYRVEVNGSLMVTQKLLDIAPFLQRMESRVNAGQLSKTLSRSSLLLVAYARVSLARDRLKDADRMGCLRLVLKAWRYCTSKRWWLTLIAVVALPRSVVKMIF